MQKGALGMKTVFCSMENIPPLDPSAAAVGYFDGFHRGHVRLLEKAQKAAERLGIQSAVLTFDPDPWTVFNPGGNLDHLLSLEGKIRLAESMGMDQMIVLHFDRQFAGLSNDEFHRLIQRLNIQDLICGYDYTYGAKGAGNVQTLQQQDLFEVEVVEEISEDEKKISSTRIERLVRSGHTLKAAELLGYYYSVPGHVGSGYRRGRAMDFPTANLEPDAACVIPQTGVYAGLVSVEEKTYAAMINIGSNPTFANTSRSIEAYLLDFSGDLYGKRVRFFFGPLLRGEKRFTGMEALKQQLTQDEQAVRPALAAHPELLKRTVRLWHLKDSSAIIM